MSISKRFWDLARSNISDFRSTFRGGSDLFEGLSEEERQALDEELRKDTVGARAGRRARQVRDAAEDAWEKAYEAAQARAGVPTGADPVEQRMRWYKTLELEPGADYEAIRKAYRRLVKLYHPDRFANDPEKYKAATEVARKITEAYEGLSALHGR
ncbi:MAG: J domain-containing protein [Myxococcales bacterium]|nr:J domain-containing protein [Myxococcales bacterium]